MSAVLRIARREIRERRSLMGAALFFGLLALVLRAVPGALWAREIGEAFSLLLFLAFPTAVALAVGSSLVGRDLAEGRLSFYFSRPLSAGMVWAGKFLGGIALVIGAFLCCCLPFSVSIDGSGRPTPGAAGLVLLALLCFMAFAHVVTTMYRSGSRLVALDLGLGALFAILFGAEVRHLTTAGAARALFGSGPGDDAMAVALAAATIAMMGAAAAQLAYGRVDAHRGHVALSAAVWTFALLALVALSLWGTWLLGVTPADVGGVGYPLFAAPRGSSLFFKGPWRQGRAGFSPVFLMDGQSGSYVRLPPERMTPPAFAADGRTAVWVATATPWWKYFHPPSEVWAAPSAGDPGDTLATARLGRGAPVIEERSLGLPDAVSVALAVDGDGQRVLLSGPSSVLLLDTPSGRLLARRPVSDVVAAEFLADGAVRLYQKETAAPGRAVLIVVDWSAKDGSRVERARVPGDARTRLLAHNRGLAVVSTGPHAKAILDADRGAVRAFSSSAADSPGAALMLSNGHVAMSLGEEVRIVSRDGATVASVPLEPQARAYALREPALGELAVGLWTPSLARRRTLLVDPATGTVLREEKEILPAGLGYDSPLQAPEPGSLASRLFMDQGGALLALEADGQRRLIVAGRE